MMPTDRDEFRSDDDVFEVCVDARHFGEPLRAQVEAHAEAMGLAIDRPLRVDDEGNWLAARAIERRGAQALRRQLGELGIVARVRPALTGAATAAHALVEDDAAAIDESDFVDLELVDLESDGLLVGSSVDDLWPELDDDAHAAAPAETSTTAEPEDEDGDDEGWGSILGTPAPRAGAVEAERDDDEDGDEMPILDWFNAGSDDAEEAPDDSAVMGASHGARPVPAPLPSPSLSPPGGARPEHTGGLHAARAVPPAPPAPIAPRTPRRTAPPPVVGSELSPLSRQVLFWGGLATAFGVVVLVLYVTFSVPAAGPTDARTTTVPRGETDRAVARPVTVPREVAGFTPGQASAASRAATMRSRTAGLEPDEPTRPGVDESDREAALDLLDEGKAKCAVGNYAECETTMQAVITLDPSLGEAYTWQLKARAALDREAREARGETVEPETGASDAPSEPRVIILSPGTPRASDEAPAQPAPDDTERAPTVIVPERRDAPSAGDTPRAPLPDSPEGLRRRARERGDDASVAP